MRTIGVLFSILGPIFQIAPICIVASSCGLRRKP
ncbi:Vmc-like lipoprotein signal peptide domain-containing protein [Stenotrophomonas forensis]